jgi:NAD dependent epimerase/dehydratase family enzyme
VRAILGEFASEVLESRRVIPQRLSDAGFTFRYRELEPALRHLLAKSP